MSNSETGGLFARFDLTATLMNDLLAVLRRRKLVVLLTLLGTVLGTYLTMIFRSEQYEAEARLLVILGRENTEVPITVDKGSVFTSGVQEEEVNSYIQLLKSRDLVKAAVRRLGVERFEFDLPKPQTLFQHFKYVVKKTVRSVKQHGRELLIRLDLKTRLSDEDAVIQLVHKSLTVQREGKSNVIDVALRLPSKRLAVDTVDALVAEYFERHIALRKVANLQDVFDGQMKRYRKELQRLLDVRARIRREWGISEVVTQRAKLLDRLHTLQSEIDAQRSQLARLLRNQEALNQVLGDLPERLVSSEVMEPNPAVDKLKESLIDMRLRRIDSGSRYVDDLPIVRAIDDAITALEKQLGSEDDTQKGEVTSVPHPARLTLEQELLDIEIEFAGLGASISTKTSQAESIQAELQRLNEGEDFLELVELERRVAEKKYLANATRREEVRIQGELDANRIANVTLLSGPSAAPEPVSPRKLTVMAIAGAVGVLLGLGLALLREWSDDTIYEVRDLTCLPHLPYLGEFVIGASGTAHASSVTQSTAPRPRDEGPAR